jgi:glycerol-3-phosphate acyltransferase PlsY
VTTFLSYLALITLSYLIGSIPFSLIFAKLIKGVDVRRTGSRNVGATNTLVSAGKRAGLLAAVFDIAKGFATVILARYWLGGDGAAVLAGLAAILGHDFSIYLSFSGGKGISTTTGVILALDPYVMLVGLFFYLIFIVATRYLILSSLLVLLLFPVLFLLFKDHPAYVLFGVAALLIALYAHRQDLLRLMAGQETKFGQAPGNVI